MRRSNNHAISCLQCEGASGSSSLTGGGKGNTRYKNQNGSKQKNGADDVAALFARHQEQYTPEVAEFFDVFNSSVKRALSYTSYLRASVLHKFPNLKNEEAIAVDIGCGTGWLTPELHDMGFSKVYGIDTSKGMIGVAFNNTPEELTDEGKVIYRTEAPSEIMGKCKLVTAVHMLYHFPTEDQLKKDFFRKVSNLLEDNGELIIISCPSDYIRNTPAHYFNSVHVNDIPAETKKNATDLQVFAKKDGFIPLSKLPKFKLKDGAQMKVTFVLPDSCPYTPKTLSLTDTFWSAKEVKRIAEEEGLTQTASTNTSHEGHNNAYEFTHYRKLPLQTHKI